VIQLTGILVSNFSFLVRLDVVVIFVGKFHYLYPFLFSW
jgi:hypothetical protein